MLREPWGYRVTDLKGPLKDILKPMWGGAVWCEAGGRIEQTE